MPWHFTKVENVESILRDGLIPQIGELSQRINEPLPLVYLFSTIDDYEDGAYWMEGELDEEAQYALFHVDVSANLDSAWTEVDTVITPDKITLITMDIDAFVPDETHYAMDPQQASPEDEDRCGI